MNNPPLSGKQIKIMEKTAVQQLCDKYEAEFRKYEKQHKKAQDAVLYLPELVLQLNAKMRTWKYAWKEAQRMLETERQQIIEAYNVLGLNGEQYYNQKYGQTPIATDK